MCVCLWCVYMFMDSLCLCMCVKYMHTNVCTFMSIAVHTYTWESGFHGYYGLSVMGYVPSVWRAARLPSGIMGAQQSMRCFYPVFSGTGLFRITQCSRIMLVGSEGFDVLRAWNWKVLTSCSKYSYPYINCKKNNLRKGQSYCFFSSFYGVIFGGRCRVL